jgi:hypothetical protein
MTSLRMTKYVCINKVVYARWTYEMAETNSSDPYYCSYEAMTILGEICTTNICKQFPLTASCSSCILLASSSLNAGGEGGLPANGSSGDWQILLLVWTAASVNVQSLQNQQDCVPGSTDICTTHRMKFISGS